MDIELARTFLKVVETGSFVRAAERLFVTQAAISRRIRILEDDLGCRLFTRNKAGAELTAPGRRFAKYATRMVQALEQARHEVGVALPYRRYLAVGARLGLWQDFLVSWIEIMRRNAPDVVLRTQLGFEADLTQQLIDGSLDIGIMYTPQNRPGFVVEHLFDDELVLVSSEATTEAAAAGYIQVEWGPEFLDRNRLLQPRFANPGIIAGVGWLGLQHILAHGGSVYLPERLARPYLERGELFHVEDAQSFTLPAYRVYPADHDPELFALALASIDRAVTEIGMGDRRQSPVFSS
ncbi:MAG: LysR family transcriptional regulator [Gammaproteobacteria bacterium]|jgi:DNA-binding transcriptional LysR family regulator